MLPAAPAAANDRPFQVARTAVGEDDDQVWSLETWVRRFSGVRGLSIEPEYVFTTSTSVQVELTRGLDRAGSQSGDAAEVEFKHLFNRIARDGWGWGLSVAVSAERLHASPDTATAIALKLPVSISLGQGAGYLHLDAGIDRANDPATADSRSHWSRSADIEYEVWNRTRVFGELACEGDAKFGQVGVRHWLRRDKLAIDFALQQQRAGGGRASGFILGLGWYDLD